MRKTKSKHTIKLPSRNGQIIDIWSLIHLLSGIIFGLIFSPTTAIILLIAWEPIEIFVISPLLAKRKIYFGYESVVNSASDIIFDVLGVLIASNFFNI